MCHGALCNSTLTPNGEPNNCIGGTRGPEKLSNILKATQLVRISLKIGICLQNLLLLNAAHHPGPERRVWEGMMVGMGLERKERSGAVGAGVRAESFRSSPQCRGEWRRLEAQGKQKAVAELQRAQGPESRV